MNYCKVPGLPPGAAWRGSPHANTTAGMFTPPTRRQDKPGATREKARLGWPAPSHAAWLEKRHQSGSTRCQAEMQQGRDGTRVNTPSTALPHKCSLGDCKIGWVKKGGARAWPSADVPRQRQDNDRHKTAEHCSESQETKRGSVLQGSTTAAHHIAGVWPKEGVMYAARVPRTHRGATPTPQSRHSGTGPQRRSCQMRRQGLTNGIHKYTERRQGPRRLRTASRAKRPSRARYYKALRSQHATQHLPGPRKV